MKIRSGLGEILQIALRYRAPLEPIYVGQSLLAVFQPLFSAWTDVWRRGTKEGIRICNEVVERSVALLDLATERGRAGSSIYRLVVGEAWTPEQEKRIRQAQAALGESRIRLAACIRAEGGEKAVDLLDTSNPAAV